LPSSAVFLASVFLVFKSSEGLAPFVAGLKAFFFAHDFDRRRSAAGFEMGGSEGGVIPGPAQ
jgi:hypothetical protein